jgi:hypothetical protein
MFTSEYKSCFQNFLPIIFSAVLKPNENVYKCLQKNTFAYNKNTNIFLI